MEQSTRRLLVLSILLGGFLSSLTETILNNALPTIMRAFSINQSTAQWLSTGYILVVGIMMPAAAFFFNRFRLKPLFLTTLTLFLVGTTIAACAPSFVWLLLGRIIQAISVGITMPLTQNVLTMVYPPEKRGTAMGMAAVVIILGPAIGPTLSGWIVDNFVWQMLFWALIPVTIVILILSAFSLRNINEIHSTRLDTPSLFLSTIGFGTLLYGFSNVGMIVGINLFTICLISIGILVVGIFLWYQLRLTTPLLDIRVFKSPSFTKTTILAALTNIAMLGTELIVPLYLQDVRGISPMTSGMMLLPGVVLMTILTPMAGRILDNHGIKTLSFVGFGVLTVATIPMIWFNSKTSLLWIIILYAIRMGAIALVMMPTTTSGINALPDRLVVHGNTVSATFRQVASSLGTAGLVTVSSVVAHSSNLAHGYQAAFGVTSVVSLICLVLTITLKNWTKPEI